jgi:hypothetical protein
VRVTTGPSTSVCGDFWCAEQVIRKQNLLQSVGKTFDDNRAPEYFKFILNKLKRKAANYSNLRASSQVRLKLRS